MSDCYRTFPGELNACLHQWGTGHICLQAPGHTGEHWCACGLWTVGAVAGSAGGERSRETTSAQDAGRRPAVAPGRGDWGKSRTLTDEGRGDRGQA